MSKGSPRVIVRFPPTLIASIEEAITRANKQKRGKRQTVSDFLRQAVQERLAKLRRSNRPRAQRAAAQPREEKSRGTPTTQTAGISHAEPGPAPGHLADVP